MTIKVAIHGADVKLCYEKFDKLWGSSQGCCEKPMLIIVTIHGVVVKLR